MSEDVAQVRGLILDRLWKAYESIDGRRRRAFFLLMTMSVVFGLIVVLEPQTLELPLIGFEAGLVSALLAGPLFILATCLSHLYLCAHTLKSYIAYLEHLEKAFPSALKSERLPFGWLYGNLKQRDITEMFNLYHFPIRPVRDYDDDVSKFVTRLAHVVMNVLLLVVVGLPYFVYWSVVHRLREHTVSVDSELYSLREFSLIYYEPLLLAPLLAAVYFFFRAKSARNEFRRRCFG